METAPDALEAAQGALVAVGDHERAAEAEVLLAGTWFRRAQRDRSLEHIARAVSLVEQDLPSPAKARVLSEVARHGMLMSDFEDALRVGREAVGMAEALGLEEIHAHALDTVGCARFFLGDSEGREDV